MRFILQTALFSLIIIHICSCDVLLESFDPEGFKETQARNADHSVKRPNNSQVTLDPNIQQILENAVWSGDLTQVKRAENLGANLNYGKGKNLPNAPLFTALSRQYSQIQLAKSGTPPREDEDYLSIINYIRSKSTNLSDCGYGSCVLSLMCLQSLNECKKAVNDWGMNASYTDINYLMVRNTPYETFEFLFRHGLDASKGDNVLKTIKEMDIKTLELLLKNGADKRVDEQVSRKIYALEEVFEQPKKVELLLEYGADPAIKCDSPMQLAINYGVKETVALLLEYGIDPNKKSCNYQFDEGVGMLGYAIYDGQLEIAEFLKAHGAK